tara:strand:- start:3071 stop:4501 length:1431 start_codon:yes stop_codon:yes gene_type:complete
MDLQNYYSKIGRMEDLNRAAVSNAQNANAEANAQATSAMDQLNAKGKEGVARGKKVIDDVFDGMDTVEGLKLATGKGTKWFSKKMAEGVKNHLLKPSVKALKSYATGEGSLKEDVANLPGRIEKGVNKGADDATGFVEKYGKGARDFFSQAGKDVKDAGGELRDLGQGVADSFHTNLDGIGSSMRAGVQNADRALGRLGSVPDRFSLNAGTADAMDAGGNLEMADLSTVNTVIPRGGIATGAETMADIAGRGPDALGAEAADAAGAMAERRGAGAASDAASAALKSAMEATHSAGGFHGSATTQSAYDGKSLMRMRDASKVDIEDTIDRARGPQMGGTTDAATEAGGDASQAGFEAADAAGDAANQADAAVQSAQAVADAMSAASDAGDAASVAVDAADAITAGLVVTDVVDAGVPGLDILTDLGTMASMAIGAGIKYAADAIENKTSDAIDGVATFVDKGISVMANAGEDAIKQF